MIRSSVWSNQRMMCGVSGQQQRSGLGNPAGSGTVMLRTHVFIPETSVSQPTLRCSVPGDRRPHTTARGERDPKKKGHRHQIHGVVTQSHERDSEQQRSHDRSRSVSAGSTGRDSSNRGKWKMDREGRKEGVDETSLVKGLSELGKA